MTTPESVVRRMLTISLGIVLYSSQLAAAQAPALPQCSVSQADSPAATSAEPTEILVNHQCHRIKPVYAGAASQVSNKPSQTTMFCRLESVKMTQHEEAVSTSSKPHHVLVTVAEQDYLLQNTNSAPVVFVVEHVVPRGWQVDSEPGPTCMEKSAAVFRVNAQPGQTVRFHVGLRTTRIPRFVPLEPVIAGAPNIR